MALLAGVAGTSVLSLSLAGTPAQASEERLHNETFISYALASPGSGSAGLGKGGDKDSFAGTRTAAGDKSNNSAASNEPELEDPGLPSYDGPEASPLSGARPSR